MNYLAHAFLSQHNENLMIGNFIADHIRGNQLHQFEPEIVAGIKMHRQIDSFTDAHPLFRESKRLFYNGFERYSGVLVDIYFDFFLANKFKQYADLNLDEFALRAYSIYQNAAPFLPENSHRFLSYMIKNNLFVSYGKFEQIQLVLSHLSNRIKHDVRLENSADLFLSAQKELEKNFETFFKDISSEFKDFTI